MSHCANDAANKSGLVADLLSVDAGADCVVSWLERPEADIDKDSLRNELEETQALVLWVTAELLTSASAGRWPPEYEIARELRLPIIPVADNAAHFPYFTELAGAIHGIAMTDNGYRAKLKAQLDIFLASEDTIREINLKAFSGSIFLSYRKADIAEARRFLKTFHDIEGLESVSVWYDSFLTAGRNFDFEIKEAILGSDIFLLLVTPRLATPGNYVQTVEYPFARKTNKPVVSVEALPTDISAFKSFFPGADAYVPVSDTDALRRTFMKMIAEKLHGRKPSTEQIYFLGLAYLDGIGVERDIVRALRLLEQAALHFNIYAKYASEQLADIYEYGIGVETNFVKAFSWRLTTVMHAERLFGQNHIQTATAYNNAGVAAIKKDDFSIGIDYHKKTLATKQNLLGEDHQDIATCYNNIAVAYEALGDYDAALFWHFKALALCEKVLGEDHIDTAATCNNIGLVCAKQHDSANAKRWFLRALAIKERLLGDEHPDTATTYNNIASELSYNREYAKALEMYFKALKIKQTVYGEHHIDVADIYNNIALVHVKQGDNRAAFEWTFKAMAIYEKLLGTMHTKTAISYANAGGISLKCGFYDRAAEFYFKALAAFEKTLDSNHPNMRLVLNNLSASCVKMGESYAQKRDFLNTAKWYEKAAETNKKAGKKDVDAGNVYINISKSYYCIDAYQKALDAAVEAFYIYAYCGDNESRQMAYSGMKNLYALAGYDENNFNAWLIKQGEGR